MSMLGISILNEIVNVEGITDSDKIVGRLDTLIHKSLNRSRADGLDMALCSYDWTNRTIQFTGAMNHLVYYRGGQQYILKADQYSVNMTTDDEVTFSKQELKLKKGDMIYLYSDGFMDQFGGERDKKFSIKRFYELLHDIHNLALKDQESYLENKLNEWKKDCVQTDDITIMGIRF
jgi:serine phosphatase RsbU (regulator of sigma subunit)